MSARLDALRRQFDEVRSGIDAIEAAPAGTDGDLSPDQQAQVDTLFARADDLKAEIEPLAKREQSLAATADVLAKLPGTRTPIARAGETKAPDMSAGEFFSLFARAQEGDADATRILRAVDDQTTADVAGLLPTPIVGNLIKLADSNRPVFSSFTSRPMPDKGRTFTRPRIAQRVAVAEQSTAYTDGVASGTVGQGAEKSQLVSRKLTATGDEVTKTTWGGVLDVSQQAIDWTDPALLDIAIQDFFDVYAEVSEAYACEFLEGLVTSNVSDWDTTDPGTVVASITGGVEAAYASAKRMPDTLWLDLASAMDLAGTTNSDDSITAISMIKRALADVGLNLNFVIGPQLSADTVVFGASGLVESYEKRNGIMQAVNVPLHGLDIGYSAYLAYYSPKVSTVAVGVVGLVDGS